MLIALYSYATKKRPNSGFTDFNNASELHRAAECRDHWVGLVSQPKLDQYACC